ncbi:hypothetical protein KKA47_06970, partial [bacterium]|nr:hypothetical protein [bacterium]
LFLLAFLVSILCYVGCGSSSDTSSDSDDTITDSTQLDPCRTLADSLTNSYFSRTPVEDMEKLSAWTGYVFHHTHVHNEGVGKWYLYPSESIEVKAAIDGRICTTIEDGSTTTIGGTEVLEDSDLDLYFGGSKRISYGHMWVLESLRNAYNAAGDNGLEISEGDLLGYTSPGGSALDFQITDDDENNDLPDEASHVKNWVCPMNYYESGSTLREQLLSKWSEMTYQPALESKVTAEASNQRGSRGSAELASDTCSAVNVNTMNYGTIWGSWYNERGESTDSSIGSWFHYIRGTVTLLPNSLLNSDTYTVGFDDEDGLWSEMRSNAGVGTPWFNTSYLASLWLPEGVSASDSSGCFVLSLYSMDYEDAVWVYFELTAVSGGDDLLNLTRTSASNLSDCLSWGESDSVEESFSRYPTGS